MKIFGNWQSEFVSDSNIIDLLVNMNANANSKIDDWQFNRDSFSPLLQYASDSRKWFAILARRKKFSSELSLLEIKQNGWPLNPLPLQKFQQSVSR